MFSDAKAKLLTSCNMGLGARSPTGPDNRFGVAGIRNHVARRGARYRPLGIPRGFSNGRIFCPRPSTEPEHTLLVRCFDRVRRVG